MNDKGLVTRIGEAIDQYREARRYKEASLSSTEIPNSQKRSFHWLLPTPGNVLFTLLVITSLLWAQNVGALTLSAPIAPSTGTIAYQGRLADSGGAPLTGTYNMIFRLYTATSGGAPLWEEQWTGSNSVHVSDGLFNVMLGSLTSIPQSIVSGNPNLFLGVTVGTDSEMSPRVQLGSVPFAVQAQTLAAGASVQGDFAVAGNLEVGSQQTPANLNVVGAVNASALGRTIRPAVLTTSTMVTQYIPNDGVAYPLLAVNLNLPTKSDVYGFFNVTCVLRGYRTWTGVYLDGQSTEMGWHESDITIGAYTFSSPLAWTDMAAGTHSIQVKQARQFQTGENFCWRGYLEVGYYPVE